MIKSRLITALLCCFMLVTLASCNDDDDCTTCPTGAAPEATMTNIWPHADGNAWIFEMTYQEYDLPETSMALVDTTNPEDLPSMEALHAELQMPLPETPAFTGEALYRFALNGDVVTESGVTAQQVEETIFLENSATKSGRTLPVEKAPSRLLRLVAQARPDLRDAILPFLEDQTKDLDNIAAPMFLGGYAFAAEDTGYFSYGDVDANHSWIYLGSSLDPGAEFSKHQIPGLTDDIWLYGRIWSQGNLTIGGLQYENVVECMYLIDMGEQNITDEEGNLLGTFNPYMYGTSHFAPAVGPIKGLERSRLNSGYSPLDDEYPYIIEYDLDLVGGSQSN